MHRWQLKCEPHFSFGFLCYLKNFINFKPLVMQICCCATAVVSCKGPRLFLNGTCIKIVSLVKKQLNS